MSRYAGNPLETWRRINLLNLKESAICAYAYPFSELFQNLGRVGTVDRLVVLVDSRNSVTLRPRRFSLCSSVRGRTHSYCKLLVTLLDLKNDIPFARIWVRCESEQKMGTSEKSEQEI